MLIYILIVNKYKSEKEETKNERNHLSKLLKRIEERKLERAVKINCQTQANRSRNTQHLNHKKRKRKAENLDECSIENINLNENIPSDVKEKKKNTCFRS